MVNAFDQQANTGSLTKRIFPLKVIKDIRLLIKLIQLYNHLKKFINVYKKLSTHKSLSTSMKGYQTPRTPIKLHKVLSISIKID